MRPSLFYFVGFAGHTDSTKVKLLQDALRDIADIHILKPAYLQPDIAFDHITEQIKVAARMASKVVFAGISFGAFYAMVLGERFDVPYLLVNPVLSPSGLIDKIGHSALAFLGVKEDTYQLHATYKSIEDGLEITQSLATVLVANDDEYLNHSATVARFKYAKVTQFDTGTHSFLQHWPIVIDKLRDELLTIEHK